MKKAALGERPIASQEEGGEEKEGDAATEEGCRPKKAEMRCDIGRANLR